MNSFTISHQIIDKKNLYKISYNKNNAAGKISGVSRLSLILNIDLDLIEQKVHECHGIIIHKKISNTEAALGYAVKCTGEQLYFLKREHAQKFKEWLDTHLILDILRKN